MRGENAALRSHLESGDASQSGWGLETVDHGSGQRRLRPRRGRNATKHANEDDAEGPVSPPEVLDLIGRHLENGTTS
jgi:hypothetical protein